MRPRDWSNEVAVPFARQFVTSRWRDTIALGTFLTIKNGAMPEISGFVIRVPAADDRELWLMSRCAWAWRGVPDDARSGKGSPTASPRRRSGEQAAATSLWRRTFDR